MLEQGEREHPAGTPPVEAQDANPLLPLHLGAPLVGSERSEALVRELLGVGQSRTRSTENPLPIFGGRARVCVFCVVDNKRDTLQIAGRCRQ